MSASAWPAVTPAARPVPAVAVIASGAAVLLAGAPVTAVVQGASWPGYAVAVVAAVVGVGLLLRRRPGVVVAGQAVAVIGLLTAVFTSDDVLPGPTAFREFGGLLVGAGQQIEVGIAPVAPTPEILFLVTAAFGLVAVAVHLAAVTARAPAAAGVPLLAVFAVPAALADDLLPWWAVAAAAAGFGLLLVAHGGHRFLDGAALVAGAVVLALGIGAGSGIVGTAGRFDGGTGGGAGGSIGLSPFTALRGQLDQSAPVELFRVRGLPRPAYLRALTLRDYIPEAGWQASRPGPGTELPGPVPRGAGDPPGDLVDVQIENVAFRDYWLPLYGEPLDVAGLTESRWTHDPGSGTAYSARARQEDGWQERALLPAPSVGELRAAAGPPGVDRQYLSTAGVDERVAEITRQVVADRATAFDRALALQDHFTGTGSPFRYSLQTEPGSGDDALVEFLTTGRAGYCEQFASAMAVMLRTMGIPARVAVGFTAGTATGEVRSIGTGDAHAWVEAWFPGIGWTTFDPTPLSDGRAITPPYVLEARGETGGQVGADAAPADELTPGDQAGEAPAPEQATPEPTGPDPEQPSPVDDGRALVSPVLVVLALATLALVPAGLRARERRRRLAAVGTAGPDAPAAGWAELLAESTDRGVPSSMSETVRGAARRLVREHRLDGETQDALRRVVGAVESSWYGGQLTTEDLDEPVRLVRAGIAAGSPLSVRDRLLPRSILLRSVVKGPSRRNADGHPRNAAAPRT